MKHVVVDPITRIEGHLRAEVTVDDSGKVTDAVSSGTAWRGLELVMHNRDPRDAWAYIQRICGVCTTAHALASVRAVEDALQIRIPKNANYIRNIMAATLTVQDHLVHFYHLHALDWVSPVEALAADPIATANLQQTVLSTYRLPFRTPNASVTEAYEHDFPAATPQYFEEIKGKVKAIVESGQLGIFAANWWDHPDYKLLPPEVHLMAVAHYLEMLDKQRELVTPHVIFGGKNPHPHYVVGGMPCSISMTDGNAPVNAARLSIVDRAINMGRSLVNNYYLPDLLAIGTAYVKAGRVDGGGLAGERVLAYGSYPLEPNKGTTNGDFFNNLLVRCNGVVENFKGGAKSAKFTEIAAEDITLLVHVSRRAAGRGSPSVVWRDERAVHRPEGRYGDGVEGAQRAGQILLAQDAEMARQALRGRPARALHHHLHEGTAGSARHADVGGADDARSDRCRLEGARSRA